MWYVWPSLKGTRTTKHPELELPDVDATVAYLDHPQLRARLLAITIAATVHLRSGVAAAVLFGKQHRYDAPKFHEVSTCFLMAAEARADAEAMEVFEAAVRAIAGGRRNEATVRIMNGTALVHVDTTATTVCDDTDLVTDTTTTATLSVLGDVHLFHVNVPYDVGEDVKRPAIAFHFVIDNSGSMGHLTKDCTHTFGGLLGIPGVDIRPGSVTVFNDEATVLSRNIRTQDDMQRLSFPPQGQTNITAGICAAANVIATSRMPSVIHIMVYLSDGGHNCGDRLTDDHIATMRKTLDVTETRMVVVVVGIANNDTSLGMKVKAGLENVTINSLESVYFARNASEMRPVLDQLVAGCAQGFAGGRSVDFRLSCGHFMETLGPALSPFIIPGTNLCIPVRTLDGRTPQLMMNGSVVEVSVTPFTAAHVPMLVEAVLPQLRRLRVAHGVDSILERVRMLESTIALAEQLSRSTRRGTSMTLEDIGILPLPAGERLAIHKAAKQHQSMFAAERAELRVLVANLANDSAAQASFLSGCNRKYAAKAVIRADMVDTDPANILKELHRMKDVVVGLLAIDEAIVRSVPETPHHSVLSLLTPQEQFGDWLEVLRHPEDLDLSSIYSHLVALGFTGVPATFVTNNAVQVDPLQTECRHIEPTPIDSATLSLALQMDLPPRGPMGANFESMIVLVDPSCPNTSLHLMRKSLVYKFLTSVTLCKDLYMFNFDMTLSMHVHGLTKAMYTYTQTKSSAYLELCVRILYSLRKFYGKMPEKFAPLFKHWWTDLASITRAQEDECPHPMILPVLFAIMDDAPVSDDPYYPMVNFLNEVLARKMRYVVQGAADAEGNGSTQDVAESILQQWCGINASNCPAVAEDVLTRDLPREEVKAACHAYIVPDEMDPTALRRFKFAEGTDIRDYVSKVLHAPYWTFQLCHSVQRYLKDRSLAWDDAAAAVEAHAGVPPEMTAYLVEALDVTPPVENVFLRRGPGSKDASLTMFIQATLCHDSKTRVGTITMMDVHDPMTLRDHIVELRMAVYGAGCKSKHDRWLATIGDLTLATAKTCDVGTFDNMVGAHTHGHCRSVFLALALAGAEDIRKREIFLEKSNVAVKSAFNKIVARAKKR